MKDRDSVLSLYVTCQMHCNEFPPFYCGFMAGHHLTIADVQMAADIPLNTLTSILIIRNVTDFLPFLSPPSRPE